MAKVGVARRRARLLCYDNRCLVPHVMAEVRVLLGSDMKTPDASHINNMTSIYRTLPKGIEA